MTRNNWETIERYERFEIFTRGFSAIRIIRVIIRNRWQPNSIYVLPGARKYIKYDVRTESVHLYIINLFRVR